MFLTLWVWEQILRPRRGSGFAQDDRPRVIPTKEGSILLLMTLWV